MPQATDVENNDTLMRQKVDELLIKGEFEIAEKQIIDMLRSTADDPALLNALGTILASRGEYDKAEDHFSRAITTDPGYGDAYYNLGLLQSRLFRQVEAVENFIKAVKLNPNDCGAHNVLGVIYHSQGKNLLAKGHFIKALEASPLFKNALLNLFEVCWDNGYYDEALTWVERLMKTLKTADRLHFEESQAPTGADGAIRPFDPSYVPSPVAGKLTFKRRSPASDSDLFDKFVPAELRRKKTGMNIAIVADFNIAGQLTLLQKMINQHTIHKARLVVLQGDYLSYDKDLILSEGKREDYYEARRIIESADFYHIGRFPVNFGDIDWSRILRPDNSVVQYYGSEIRWNAEAIYNWHTRNKILGISCWDYTMIQNAPLFYHVNIMCNLDRILPCDPPGDIVRICHPPTNRAFKKTELFLSVMERLKKKYPVELELIEHKSNQECLELKKRCNITYDQISVGIYGLSAIESMAAGHAVICGMSNFASSYHPDNPIVYAHENNLYEVIERLIQNKDEIVKIGNAGRDWARRHHDPKKIIRQFTWLYDLAANGHRLVDERDAFMIG